MSEGLEEFDRTTPKKTKPTDDLVAWAKSKPEDPLVWVNCSVCGMKFQTPEWTTETGEPQVCSQACAYEMGH